MLVQVIINPLFWRNTYRSSELAYAMSLAVWHWIVILWHSFWIGGGSLTAWALAEQAFPFHTTLARAVGAGAGAVVALVLPRLLVRLLIESPPFEAEAGVPHSLIDSVRLRS